MNYSMFKKSIFCLSMVMISQSAHGSFTSKLSDASLTAYACLSAAYGLLKWNNHEPIEPKTFAVLAVNTIINTITFKYESDLGSMAPKIRFASSVFSSLYTFSKIVRRRDASEGACPPRRERTSGNVGTLAA